MAEPRRVRRRGREAHAAWNAFIDFCVAEDLANLTAIQRQAWLVFWYMSEVNNGGHFQYLVNRRDYDHREVVEALRALGALSSARILQDVIGDYRLPKEARPETVEEYLALHMVANLESFDRRFNAEGDPEIQRCLVAYLEQHESEFVRWDP